MKNLFLFSLLFSATPALAAVHCTGGSADGKTALHYFTDTTVGGVTFLRQESMEKDSGKRSLKSGIVRSVAVNKETLRLQTWPQVDLQSRALKYISIGAFETGENYGGTVSVWALRRGPGLSARWELESTSLTNCFVK